MDNENIITKEELKKAGKEKKSFPLVVVFFVVAIVFFGIQGYLLMKHHHVSAYNVQTPTYDNITGSVRGIVLRDEALLTADSSGYVTLYKQDGDWLSKGDTILLQSTEKQIAEQIREITGENSFSQTSLRKIADTLKTGISSLDTENFDTVLELKTNTQETVFSRLISDNSAFENYLKNISVSREYSTESGFYMSWSDGWEGISATDLSSAMLSGENYRKNSMRSGDRKLAGETIGKLALDNRFQIAFLIDDASYSAYNQKKTLTIRTMDGLEITGTLNIEQTTDGKYMGVLSFQKYGAHFLNERFLNFAVLDKEVYGYKIPESAIIQKTFFVVPEEYVMQGEDGKYGVLLEGNHSATFITCTVYRKTDDDASIVKEDGYCYVYSEELSRGDLIHNSNTDGSGEKFFTIGQEIPVDGVFQVNSGYCVFKPISRIKNSLDTAFVMIYSTTSGTVRSYDRILLEAQDFSENEFLFE